MITPEQKRAYEEDGVVCLRQVFDAHWLDTAARAIEHGRANPGPMYLDYTIRSQIADGLQLATGAKNAVTEFYQDRGRMPANNDEAGLSASNTIQSNYVSSVAVGNQDGVITITFGNRVNVQILDETVTLTADTTAAGSLQWVCASGGVIQPKNLPSSCR